MAFSSTLWWIVASFLGFLVADSDAQVCAWFQSRAATVRDTLFIDGGILVNNTWSGSSWQNTNPRQWEPKGELYAFNYSTPFDYRDGVPDLGLLVQTKPLTVDLSRWDAPLYRSGAMFADDYELYTYGGLPVTDAKSASTIVNYPLYPIESQTIFTAGPNLDYPLSDIDNYVTAGASISIPSEKLAFYFSGMRNSAGGALEQYGIEFQLSNSTIKVDMSATGKAIWSETSLPDTIPGRADGQLVWVPVSSQGVLLAIGGVLYPQDLFSFYLDADQTKESKDNSPGFMTTIGVYDVATGNWYAQPTAGDEHPGQLSKFCAVVAGKPGDSSFEIYIYGGDNGLSVNDAVNAQDEVWVLSVPSFTWSKAQGAKSGHGRSGHVCSMPFPDQMLVLGGWNYDVDGFCIVDGSVVDVFNLNELTWTKQYDPKSGQNYTTPPAVKKTPAASPDPDVAALFAQQYDENKLKHWYPYKEQSPPSNSTPLAAIIGGAVGGGVTVLVAFLVWYLWPSRVQKRRQRKQSEAGTTSTLRSGRVSRWLPGVQRPSVDVPQASKDLASETTTEVDGRMSPPPAAEAYGDYYFRPHASPIQPSAAEIRGESTLNPRRRSQVSPIPPRSARSPTSGSMEVDGEEIHEKDGNSKRTSQFSELGQGPVDFRQHPQYPYSIDRVASSEGNSLSHRNPLGSNISHVSGRSRQHSNIAPSPVAQPASVAELNDPNAMPPVNEKGDTDTYRPGLHHHTRSISSDIPTIPVAGTDNLKRPEMEQRLSDMSATSGPLISPMFYAQHDNSTEGSRPTHHRHGSSNTSGFSNNIALPPPVNPASPSSVYSPTSAGANTKNKQEAESAAGAPSAENTLVGNGPSPMTEKLNPMNAVATQLASSPTSPTGMIPRRPVGSRRGLGIEGSAYEENNNSRGYR